MTSLPLASRVALVTGASRGLGFALALALARSGAHVVALARTQGGLEELDDAIRREATDGATLVPMSVTDDAGLERLAAALHQRYGRLDVLVGNAGVPGPSSPLAHIPPKTWRDAIEVNLNANFQLIRCMEPLLRASDAGRAVFMTAELASAPRAYLGAAAASKAGLEAMVQAWAQENAATALRINLFDPGPMRTRYRAANFPGEDPMTLPAPEEVAAAALELCLPSCRSHGERRAFIPPQATAPA